MINFLHTFNPQPILISLGPIQVYWYGLFIVLGVLAAIGIALKLAGYYDLKKNTIIDLAFWLILGGIIGARVYHIFLEWRFYLEYPLSILKIWQGGLAIHGAIIVGLFIIWQFSKKEKINFWLITSIIAPGLVLAQAIGRFGNYFNQELFGKPTDLAWGIPINILNRPMEFLATEFFHPTFLYESIGSLFIFLILIYLHILVIRKKRFNNFVYCLIFSVYLILYSILRFSLEFIRIDITPEILGLRWPQIASLIIILLTIILIIYKIKKDKLEIIN